MKMFQSVCDAMIYVAVKIQLICGYTVFSLNTKRSVHVSEVSMHAQNKVSYDIKGL